MRMMLTLIASLALSGFLAAQQGRSCKNNPELVAPCFTMHGRIFYSNGTPSLRIWRVGTKRILGVLPPENEIVPTNLSGALAGFENQVYGNFEVCPFTKEKPGEMQMVCVESAHQLVVRNHGD